MDVLEIDRDELLRGLDADERARTLIEWGLEGNPDPKIETLRYFTQGRTGEYSRRIGPDEKPPERTWDQWQRELRFERIHGKSRPRQPLAPEELPATSLIENLQDGCVPDPFASIAGCSDWATKGDSAHPDRVNPPELEDLPGTSHTEHPAKGHHPPVGGDWITKGVSAHLERERTRLEEKKALKGKPDRPYANDPFVSKAEAAANACNPFTDVRPTRLAELRLDEVARVYDAMAFARHSYGRRMNAHLTIRWSAVGVGEADAPKVLAELLNRAGKWFAIKRAEPTWVWSQKVSLPDQLLWVYVHEKAPTYGFHTHVLLSFDTRLCKAFREWVFDCLAQLLHRARIPGTTAVLRRSYAKSAEDEDDLHWFWFKYVIKQLDPEAVIESPFCDKVVTAREIFEPRRMRTVLPVADMRLVGVCRRLDIKARTEAKFVSHREQNLELYSDLGARMPQLQEEDRLLYPELPDDHVDDFPNLRLAIVMIGENADWACEFMNGTAPQYMVFKALWDRLTIAESRYQAAAGGRQRSAAKRLLDEARELMEWAEIVISLDRWDLMPKVWFEIDGALRRPRIDRSYRQWLERLAQATSKANAAYFWLKAVPGRTEVDLRPREKMKR